MALPTLRVHEGDNFAYRLNAEAPPGEGLKSHELCQKSALGDRSYLF